MSDYVELDRLFVEYDESEQGENDSTSFVDYLFNAKSWNQLLEGRCTVVIAEAGTGKSEEFRQQTRKLVAEGKPAFYAALDLLAKLPLQTALAIGNADDLNVWQAGSEHGYFFLDAVDEAKLIDPRDFAIAIANFASAVEVGKGRYSLVVSTRPHAWQANADRAMLAERLDLKPAAEYTKGKEPHAGAEDFEAVDEGDGTETTETKQTTPVSVVRLAGLSTQQVKTFAKARAVERPEDFIAAIEQANAEVFATRPADLPGLIALWRRDGKIGKYSDVVRFNVEMKLGEQNPAYKGRGIALEHAKLGAQALAAAVTLSGQTSFLLPDQSISEKVRSSSIDPASVLQSWSSEEINALLSTALFDESLYGTVRFHHRTAREYLCACWLARLLDQRKNRRQVEELLFARPYGTERLVVRPAMKPIAAWLALTDQNIRDQVMNADPRVLLEHGDASALDVGTRGSLLKLVADRYRDRNHTPIRMDVREVRRFADKRLSNTLQGLFQSYRDHVDVRHLLLRVVREGAIPGFESIAFSFVIDGSIDTWTKSLSVQVITATGSSADKKRLAKLFLKKPASVPRDVVGHALEGLVPSYVGWKQLVEILGPVVPNEEFSSDQLNLELGALLGRIEEKQAKLDVLTGLESLLATPPLHNTEFTRISTRYDWLLVAAGELAIAMARSDQNVWSRPALLTVLSMCQQADHLQRYTSDIDRKSSALLAENPDLRHLLFWHEVQRHQQSGHGPVVDWWKLSHLPALRGFDLPDFDRFISAIRERGTLDDKRTALSAAFAAWAHSGRIAEKLDELRIAAAGDAVLAADLEKLISPPPPDATTRKALRDHERMERESEQERKKRNEAKRKWIERLRGEPSQVGDLSIARDGKIWNNTLWLFDEARKAQKKNSVWTVTDWQSLVPTFGEAVASHFREFCKQFWRTYRPQVRSEYAGGDHSTPSTIIIGLSGIAMEWNGSPDWAKSLSASEAELAARYAVWEMNGFPAWFDSLHEAHTAIVDNVLLAEVRWELETPSQGSRSYVLSRLRWNSKHLGNHLSPEIATLVQSDAGLTDYAVREAIIVILANDSRPPQDFIDAALIRAGQESYRRALWIAALLALEGAPGLAALKQWVESTSDNEERARRVSAVLEELFSDERSSVAGTHKAFVKAPILIALLEYQYALPAAQAGEDDSDGGYRSRNSSRGRREYLLELLFNIPGRETFDAFMALAARTPERRDHLLTLAERRAEQDSDTSSWSPSEVNLFASDVERIPRTEEELFRLTLSRLDDLKHEYEQGDESESSLLRKVSNEVELRKVIANRLKLAARSSYTTGSEEELADGKRTDIRIHHPAVDNRVPIEIKIVGQWQAAELSERLRNQLVGQYMRDSNYGIFLLVNRGGANDSRRWRVNGKLVGLSELEASLHREAKTYARKNSRVAGLEVMSVDLLKLGSTGRSAQSGKGRSKKIATNCAKKKPKKK